MMRVACNSPLPPVLLWALVAAGALLVWWDYRKSIGHTPARIVALHIAGFLLLAALLIQPELSVRFRHGSGARLAVLVDDSLSMSAADETGKTKFQEALDILAREDFFKRFRPVFFTFGAGVKRIERGDVASVRPAEKETNIAAALKNVLQTSGRDCGAVLLLTDGLETGRVEADELAKTLRTPVYPVGIGRSGYRDVSVAAVSSNGPVYAGESVKVTVQIRQSGYDGESVPVFVRESGKTVASVTIPLTGGFAAADIDLPSLAAGDHLYEIETPQLPGETEIGNNRGCLLVRALGAKIRVLYVENRLRWEYRYLKRCLESDNRLDTYALVRVGESVFQQTGGRAVKVPADILGDAEFLKQFDLVILGNLDFSNLPARQTDTLSRFVTEAGRGLLLIGGEQFLAGLRGTGLERILPVELSGAESRMDGEPFVPAMTVEAKSLGLFEGIPALPGLERINGVGRLKSGQILLLSGGRDNRPLLAASRLADGSCAVFGTDATWKWSLGSAGERSVYEQFWSRLVRYLRPPSAVLGIGRELPEIVTDRSVCAAGEQVPVEFLFHTDRHPEVRAFVKMPDGNRQPLEVRGDRALFTPAQEGVHVIVVESGGATNMKELAVTAEGREGKEFGRDDVYLKRLAEVSGGTYVPAGDAAGLRRVLEARGTVAESVVGVTRESRKFLVPVFFLLMGLCWLFRRLNSMV